MKINESGEKIFELSDFTDEKKREELFGYVEQQYSKEQIKQIALSMLKVPNEENVKIISNINLSPEVMFRLRQIAQNEKEADVFFKDNESVDLLLKLTDNEIQEARYLFNIEEITSIQDYYNVKLPIEEQKEEIVEEQNFEIENNTNTPLEDIINTAEKDTEVEMSQYSNNSSMEGFADITADNNTFFL